MLDLERRNRKKNSLKKMSKKPVINFSGALKNMAKEIENFDYVPDPNFDFRDQDVEQRGSEPVKKHKKKNIIKKYYKRVAARDKPKQTTLFSESSTIYNQKNTASLTRQKSKFRNTRREHSRGRLALKKQNTDYSLTRTEQGEIGAGVQKPRPPFKLKEVCMENGYQISMFDFEQYKLSIGKGSFGEVFIVDCKLNDCKYALKVLNKQHIKNSWYEKYIMREKEILNMLDHPNIVRLEHYFHDSENCYFLLEL